MKPLKQFECIPLLGYLPLALSLAGIFLFDIFTPLGHVEWVLYLVVVAASYCFQTPAMPAVGAILAIILMGAGYWLSPPGIDPAVAFVNRAIGMAASWALAALGVQLIKTKQRIAVEVNERQHAEEQLRHSRERLQLLADELEQRVEERTTQLVHSGERLRALSSELNLAEQRERKRLATELHDHLQQLLVLGKLKLGQGKGLAQGAPGCTTSS